LRRSEVPALVLGLVLALDSALLLCGVLNGSGNSPSGDVVRSARPKGRGLLEGYGDSGRLVPWPDSDCVAVRYEDASCGFCEQDDQHGWAALAASLQAARCTFRLVLAEPANGKMRHATPAAVPQLTLVQMGWLAQFRLTVTPTTLLFDRDGQLLWAHEGALGSVNIASAERLLSRFVPGRGSPGRP